MEELKMNEIQEIQKQISKLKSEINKLGDMRPGSLTKQIRSWGKSYWQLSYTRKGKGYTEYVSEKEYKQVQKQIKNYQRFKKISDELVDLSIKKCKLLQKQKSR